MTSLLNRRHELNATKKSDGLNNLSSNESLESDEEESLSVASRDDGGKNITNNGETTSSAHRRANTKTQATDEEIYKKLNGAVEDDDQHANKKARRATPLSSTQLTTSLVKIAHDFSAFTLAQKGQEPAYAALLIQAYKNICRDMAPHASFVDTISKIETLGGKKDVRLYLQQMRDQQRDTVLDKIIGPAARERVLHDSKTSNKNDEYFMDRSSKKGQEKRNQEDDGEENEADFSDIEVSLKAKDSSHPSNNKDEEEKEANIDVLEVSSKAKDKSHTSNDDEEEKEASFDDLERVSNPKVNSQPYDDEEEEYEANFDDMETIPNSKANSQPYENEEEEKEKEANLNDMQTVSNVKVNSQPCDEEEEHEANFDEIETVSNAKADIQPWNDEEEEQEANFDEMETSSKVQTTDDEKEERKASFDETETASNAMVNCRPDNGEEEEQEANFDEVVPSRSNQDDESQKAISDGVAEPCEIKVTSKPHNEDIEKAEANTEEAGSLCKAQHDKNKEEDNEISLNTKFESKDASESNRDDFDEVKPSTTSQVQENNMEREFELDLSDSEALVIDETPSDSQYVSDDVVFNLAQTQTKGTQSDDYFFLSEEYPTQLTSQVENSQFAECFSPPAKTALQEEFALDIAQSYDESPIKSASSQEGRDAQDLQQTMESPTQLVNSQFFITQN